MPGPKREFLKLKNVFAEAVLYKYDIPQTDRVILGWIIRHSYGWQGSDWVEVSLQTLYDAFPNISERSIRGAITRLRKSNAIRRKGSGTKSEVYSYGPQKFVQFWTYPLNVPEDKRPTYEPQEDDKEEFENASLSGKILSGKMNSGKILSGKMNDTFQGKSTTLFRENEFPENGAGAVGTTGTEAIRKTFKDIKRHDLEDLDEEESPTQPGSDSATDQGCSHKSDEEGCGQITDWRVAAKSKLTYEAATKHAEEKFLGSFVRPLTNAERSKLLRMFRAETEVNAGPMLACWILAIEQCKEERRISRAENAKTWNNIFLHVCDCFSKIYDEKKNGKKQPEKQADGGYSMTPQRANPWTRSAS